MSEVKSEVTHIGSLRPSNITNRLNALHFSNTPLVACLRHNTYQHVLYVKAQPNPVTKHEATALWLNGEKVPHNLSSFSLVKIYLPAGRKAFEFEPQEYFFSKDGLHFSIPASATETKIRGQVRYPCVHREVPLTLTQNAITFKGRLVDYSTGGILVDLHTGTETSFAWLNDDLPAMLTIQTEKNPAYSGQVTLRERGNGKYLLFPNLDPAPRYKPKHYRSRRQHFVPAPELVFHHPITGKKQALKICDLSSLGFSVEEDRARASLIPGLILRDAKIRFPSHHTMPCVPQVVYLNQVENSQAVRVGFTILQIDNTDHLRLISMVQQAQNPHAFVSNEIDTDDLFDFFFNTGFIYPSKYAEIAARREELARSYRKVYESGTDFSRHFVFQDSGQILGHLSALRLYSNTWLSHHHAALKERRAGLQVLRAISEYMNDSYRLDATRHKYSISYYRESNRFPRKFFGNFARELQSPKKTSLDAFSYLPSVECLHGIPAELPPDWALTEATAEDIDDFYNYYQLISGGLMPEALDLLPATFNDTSLNETYKANGLVRWRKLYALRQQGAAVALLDVQSSDFGLNMSDFTNATSVYIINPDPEFFTVLSSAVANLAQLTKKEEDPLLVFPGSFLPKCGVEVEKSYNLWVLDLENGMDAYMQWVNKYCR